jgi:hypothetical protein
VKFRRNRDNRQSERSLDGPQYSHHLSGKRIIAHVLPHLSDGNWVREDMNQGRGMSIHDAGQIGLGPNVGVMGLS